MELCHGCKFERESHPFSLFSKEIDFLFKVFAQFNRNYLIPNRENLKVRKLKGE